MNNSLVQRRARILLVIFFVFLAAMVLRFLQIGVLNREKILAWGESHVYHHGNIPAARGRIISADGFDLFYSERSFDLNYRNSKYLKGRHFDIFQDTISRILPRADFSGHILACDLTPQEIGGISQLLSRYPELSISSRVERKCAFPDSSISRLGGKVKRTEDRSFTGVSGWEKEFDAELSGQDGAFEVRYDRYGNWINGTLKITRQPVPGKDVVLPQNLSELLRQPVAQQ